MFFNLYCKDSNKRARNMKFTSIFIAASAVYVRVFLKKVTNEQSCTSECVKMYFHSKCSINPLNNRLHLLPHVCFLYKECYYLCLTQRIVLVKLFLFYPICC